MSIEFETALRLWPVLVTAVLVVAWFIRLESRQFFHERDFERFRSDSKKNEEKVWENIDKIRQSQSEILLTLSRIEGKLDQK